MTRSEASSTRLAWPTRCSYDGGSSGTLTQDSPSAERIGALSIVSARRASAALWPRQGFARELVDAHGRVVGEHRHHRGVLDHVVALDAVHRVHVGVVGPRV